MPRKQVPITRDGLTRLRAELTLLQESRRQEVAERIHLAKELGGTQNNAEYEDARNDRALVEGRVLQLEQMIREATVIDEQSARQSEYVRLGSAVTLTGPGGKEQHFTIVGATEASPAAGRISNESPVGRALLGHRVGDSVQVMAPSGVVRFTVVALS